LFSSFIFFTEGGFLHSPDFLIFSFFSLRISFFNFPLWQGFALDRDYRFLFHSSLSCLPLLGFPVVFLQPILFPTLFFLLVLSFNLTLTDSFRADCCSGRQFLQPHLSHSHSPDMELFVAIVSRSLNHRTDPFLPHLTLSVSCFSVAVDHSFRLDALHFSLIFESNERPLPLRALAGPDGLNGHSCSTCSFRAWQWEPCLLWPGI